jgi:hypothetical protein
MNKLRYWNNEHHSVLIMVQTGEISTIITKPTLWAYRFGKRWMEFGIAIKTLHNSSSIAF